MNDLILDSSIYELFSKAIDKHDDFLIKRYADYIGTDRWSIICSTKDWLHVAVYGLPHIDLHHESDDARSLNVIQMLMAFDLVVQAIQQLYRVFERQYPYKEDRSIFEQNVSDDKFFKQIRACFAAHPVNLDSKDGTKNKDGEKYFASWSSDRVGNGDYSVYLYSNKPSSLPIRFSISLMKILDYTKKRYLLLNNLISFIEQEEKQEHFQLQKRMIKRNDDPVQQLLILQQENQERLGREGSGGYSYEITTMLDLFYAPKDFPNDVQEVCEEYLRTLSLVIEDIYWNLQNMIFEDLPNGRLLHPEIFIENLFYSISKVFEYIHHSTQHNRALLGHHLKRLIDKGVLPPLAEHHMNKSDLHLLLLVGLVRNTPTRIKAEN
ncbi:hypothetical protein QW71_24235 [Paenibacillus sp. IHB B 3415]|uniref:hypothetical protein n=1 Tax=Paenibacillus sp. IHB B 3415 TaxID=867080 RepID=UPI000573A1B4|nr:hypothetical protein [Paenibacillus sp. IHB B 3415]KHL93250.1 hypothetical protein QW71_24235 [Paenibacillus sp. IHB B 3415]